MRLFVVRHGQSEANLTKTYAGQSDSKLTPQGRLEALEIRPVLESITFDRVYSSDLSRAVDTQKIAIPGIEGIQTPLLREYDAGSLVGMTIEEAVAKYGGEFRRTRDYLPFGGENGEMVRDRVRQFLKLLEADPCENVAAFSHRGLLNSLLQVVLQSDFDHNSVGSDNCAIHVFEYDGSKWHLLAWNYMGKIKTSG